MLTDTLPAEIVPQTHVTLSGRLATLCTVCNRNEIDHPGAGHTKCFRCWNVFRLCDYYSPEDIHRDMLEWDVPLRGRSAVVTNSGHPLRKRATGKPRIFGRIGEKRQ